MFWVNRESLTRPTLWHRRPAHVKPRCLAILFEPGVAIGLFRPGGPTFPLPVAEPPVWIGGSFSPANPGASRPRQSLCRPSGAGVLGKQRAVYETHNVTRASRPCRVGIGGFFHALRELNHVVPPALFSSVGPTFPLPVAQPSVGIGGSSSPTNPGASLPRQALCRPSGAGVLGKQRVARETHIVARASRPCGVAVGGFFAMLFVN